MTFEEFKESLNNSSPPQNLSDLLKAMWYDANENWKASHDIAQEIHSKEGSWIHAYLHRKEGDEGNASYWYQRAEKSFPTITLQDEWSQLVLSFLKK